MFKTTVSSKVLNSAARRPSKMASLHDPKGHKQVSIIMIFLYLMLSVIAGTSFYGSSIQKITSHYIYNTSNSLPPPGQYKNTISVATIPVD